MDMTDPSKAFHGFAVPDIDAARAFYSEVLGIEVTEESDILRLQVGGGTPTIVYPKPDHVPATYTVLNFPFPTSRARSTSSPPRAWSSSVTRERPSRPTRRACSGAAVR